MNAQSSIDTFLRNVWRNPLYFVAFGFGSGLLPKMPGTWGSVVGVLIYLLISHFSWKVYAVLIGVFFILGVWCCHITERDIGIRDYPGIVWDEVVGILITFWMFPVRWYFVLFGFLLFRLFDIWKPFPIRWLNNTVKGGFGVMIDDVVAGVYAWIVLHLLLIVH